MRAVPEEFRQHRYLTSGEAARFMDLRHARNGRPDSLSAVPQGIDADAVRAHLLALPGVTALHDLHIWGMSTTETALTCHLVMAQGHPGDEALSHIAHDLEERGGAGGRRGTLRGWPGA